MGPFGTCWNVRPPPCARPISEEQANPEHAFDADGRDFDEGAVTHLMRDGEHTAVRQIDIRDWRAVRLERTAGHASVHAQMLLDAFVVNSRERREQTIVEWRSVGKKADRTYGWAGHGVSSERA
jgi:hypothetical protein